MGFVAAIAMACAAPAAQAARVAPMIVDIQPVGRGSVARVELTNPDPRAFPLEVRMMRGEISETGELTLTPADDDFLVFPTQAVVQPNSQQVFRVQYVGEQALSQSQVYYMAINQVPVPLSTTENQVQVIVNFNVLVNVVPDGAQPEPFVESATPTVRNNVNGVEVRLTNRGNRYFPAGGIQWRIQGTGADGQPFNQSIEQTQMIRHIGVGVVAPGRARIFFVPTERPLGEGPIQVTLGS